MIALILSIIELLTSGIIDMVAFGIVSKSYRNGKDYVFGFIVILFIFIFGIFSPSIFVSNVGLTFFEIIVLYSYFSIIKKDNFKMVLGSALIVSLMDLITEILIIAVKVLIPINFLSKNGVADLLNLILNLLGLLLVYKYQKNIRNLLSDDNNSVFLGILIYSYLTGCLIAYYFVDRRRTPELVEVCLFMLILQTIFAVLIYYEVLKIQRNILTKQEQKQLKSENAQLKEYSDYLDKNEDELRRFKHDYQNILSSLIISVKNDDKDIAIKNLEKYTNTHFDQKALRKYKGVNHIHVEELKSIVIAKLEELYNLKIDYSFGCPKEIYSIPKSINLLDLARVIGITFDNAIEESEALIEQTGNISSAKVDAMYFQEDGDFEFTIKNKVRKSRIDIDKIAQKNYTTKKHHKGLGLSNVERIADKYLDQMIINYFVKNDYFTFKLVIFSDEERDEFNE